MLGTEDNQKTEQLAFQDLSKPKNLTNIKHSLRGCNAVCEEILQHFEIPEMKCYSLLRKQFKHVDAFLCFCDCISGSRYIFPSVEGADLPRHGSATGAHRTANVAPAPTTIRCRIPQRRKATYYPAKPKYLSPLSQLSQQLYIILEV